MSEQKWAVLGHAATNGWLVAHPGDVCHGSDGRLECWAVHSQHDTWTEAMQEADRMARTMAVILPAGSAALTALDRVRDAWAVWKRGSDEQGRSDAYHHAHTIIAEALGDTL